MRKFLQILSLTKFVFCGLIVTSCDFSSKIHRDILIAQENIISQNYSKAAELYKRVLSRNPQQQLKIKIYYQLGELYSLQLSDGRKAISYLRKIIEETEDPLWQVKAQEKMGEINFSFLKDYEEAAKNYHTLVQFVPKLEKQDFYHLRMGLSYLNGNKLDLAKKVFHEIEKNQAHEFHKESFYYLGMCSFQSRKWEEAIEFWKEYLKWEERKDKAVETKFLIANAYETLENLSLAYDIYYNILGEYPNTEVIQNRLQSLYARRIARKR